MEWLMEWWPLIVGIIAAVTMPFWVPIAIIVMVVLGLLAGMLWGLEGIIQYVMTGGNFPVGRTISFILCGLPFFIVIGYVISDCFSKTKRSVSRQPRPVGYGGRYSTNSGGHSAQKEGHQGRTSPFFRIHQIDDAIFSDDKILRDKSGKKIGALSKPLIGEGQLVEDASGRKVGKIEPSLWNKLCNEDVQNISDSLGKKIGTIETNIWGSRVVKSSDGKTVGKIEKDIFGQTKIKKDC